MQEVADTHRHASVEDPGSITPKRDMLQDLTCRGITVAAEKMSAQLGMPHHPPLEVLRMTGKYAGTVELPMQRLAVIQRRREFALVPWPPELLKMHGTELDIGVHDRTITIAFARGRIRDLGLSR